MGYCHYCKYLTDPETQEYLKIARWTVCFHPRCLVIFKQKLLREYGIDF